MDPVADDVAVTLPPSVQSEFTQSPSSAVASTRLDRVLSLALWSVGVALLLVVALFAYNVWAQSEAQRLASPALQVIDAVAKEVAAKPQDQALRSRLAEALGAASRFEEAKQQLAVAIQLDPNYVGAYENLATIELLQKDYNQAAVHWQKVVDLTATGDMENVNQRRETAFFHLGEIALTQKDYIAAVGFFKAAIRIRKDASDSYLRLAQAHEGLGQYDAAMEQVGIALTFDPRFPEAHYERGKLYMKASALPDAAWDFRAALDGAPDNAEAQAALDEIGTFQTWYEKAVAAQASGDASAALDAVQIARSIRPDSFDASMLHGKVLEAQRDFAGAVDAYTIAVKIDASDAAAAAALKRAQAAVKRGDK
jgi:protein O-GlcNAc transferase